jgi:hypothetical protein
VVELGRLRQKDHEFKASLNYIVRPYLKRRKKDKNKALFCLSCVVYFVSLDHKPLTITSLDSLYSLLDYLVFSSVQ